MKSSYMPNLDLLRAISIIFVVFAHTMPVNFLSPLGSYGVMLFFVISAFLLSSLAKHEIQQTGKFSSRNFYIRRALRIWPIYFLYLIVINIFLIVYNDPDWFLKLTLAFFFMGNVLNTLYTYFDVPYGNMFFNHLWSLAVEEQFYLLFPFLILFFSKKKINIFKISVFIFVIGILIRCFLILIAPEKGIDNWPGIVFNTFSYIDVILFGIILGHQKEKLRHYIEKSKYLKSYILILLFFVVSITLIFDKPSSLNFYNSYSYAIYGLLFGVIVLILSSIKEINCFEKILVRMGKDSYGIYLFHIPAIFILSKVTSSPIILFILTLFLTWGYYLLYRYYEVYFRKLRERYRV